MAAPNSAAPNRAAPDTAAPHTAVPGGDGAPRVSVIGTGYLGATHAACLAELGFEVRGVDTDPDKVKRLSAGAVPVFEPGLAELVRKHVDGGRLSFHDNVGEVADWASVHFLCVGTPQRADSGAADLRFVDSAVSGLLAAGMTAGSLVVGKSTVPSGTAARLAAWLAREAPDVELAWNPEFLREGYAVRDTLRPDRLVFGVAPGGYGEAVLRQVYCGAVAAGTPVVVTDYATAELVKVAANAFLATKISFVNAMSEICDVTGADVEGLVTALAHDPRIGRQFLRPGIGFGGGCLPKDIRAFQARAEELGAGTSVAFLAEVDAVNRRARERAVALATRLLGGVCAGRRVGVLGAAFKPNSDDVRDSPALEIADALRRAGAQVRVYDPAATDNARQRFPDLDYVTSVLAAVADAELVAHLTEWAEFRDLDPAVVAAHVDRPVVFDGRGALDEARWRAAGWQYHALGR